MNIQSFVNNINNGLLTLATLRNSSDCCIFYELFIFKYFDSCKNVVNTDVIAVV